MVKKQVFVIGASGTVGKATVKALSSEFGEQVDVKAGSRNPQKVSALNDLKAVTVVEAEMGNRAALKETFRGVESLFIVTPAAENRAQLAIETARAAQDAGVKFLLVVSAPSAALPDTTFGKQFNEIELTTSSLEIPCVILRLTAFLETFIGLAPIIAEESCIYTPVGPSKSMAAIALDDIGLAAATILASPREKHAGNTYTLMNGLALYGDLTAALSKHLGRKIDHVQISFEESIKAFKNMGMSEWQTNGIHQLLKYIEAGNPAADPANVNDFSKITGKKPTDLSTWLTKMRTVFK